MRSYNPRSVLIGVIGMSIHLRVWGINSSLVLSGVTNLQAYYTRNVPSKTNV